MRVERVAFDLYGTLLNVSGLAQRLRAFAGEEAPGLLARWRKAQLDRTWGRTRAGPRARPARRLFGRAGRRVDVTHLLASGCSRKNSHITLEASMLRLVVPTNHSGSGPPPGQVWPPPWMV